MSTDVAAEIKVGDEAPDFTMKDQDQNDVKLSDFKGKKNVVLACFIWGTIVGEISTGRLTQVTVSEGQDSQATYRGS